MEQIAATYAIGITGTVAELIDRDDPNDPIARQFVPDLAELAEQPGEMADPTGDLLFSPIEGIVHRYPDRVLLKLLHICPVYCRFCFRRAVVGPNSPTHLSPEALSAAIGYIAGASRNLGSDSDRGRSADLIGAETRGDHGEAQSHRSCENPPHSYKGADCRSLEDHGANSLGFCFPPARRFTSPCMPIIPAN